MKKLFGLGAFVLLCVSAQAQSFSSGSTGADGALNPPVGLRVVQLPESRVLNYTTVDIPNGCLLTFRRNSRNTPVIILAQGNVNIGGTMSVDGGSDPDTPLFNSTPGPGGFYGGAVGQPGFGPGGATLNEFHGRWVGPLSLVPIIGGSGGAGAIGCFGGGGGGAIVIASSTTINLSGVVRANSNAGCNSATGPTGSGGAIRLVANSISVSGSLQAVPTVGGANSGVIRIEAPIGALTFTGSASPAAVLSTINPVVVSTTPPVLTIVSVGGFAVPANAGQRFDTVDLLLPNQLVDPILVVVQGNSIPVGTQVSIRVVNGPDATTTPAALQGTFASSTASPTISNLNRTAVTYLLASANFDPPMGSGPSNQKGANYVDKVRLEVLIGAKPKYIFLREDGTVITPDKLRPEFLAQFGQ